MTLTEIFDRDVWDKFVAGHPNGHPLQLWGWGESKRANGWSAHRLVVQDGEGFVSGAQVLLWQVPKLGYRLAYVPRGPVAAPGSPEAGQLLAAIVGWAKTNKVLYLRIEPAWKTGAPKKGWIRAKHHVQLPETYTIDLAKSEDELMSVMSHKHRQYIRKSERDGVQVDRVLDGDLAPMYALYEQTATRAGFGIHSAEYYRSLHKELGASSYLYYARLEGQSVAFLWLAATGKTAYELYGGVDARGGEMKANYFMKWQAITQMKEAGYKIYDFNGRLNEGVSRFKDGFGPDSTDYIGTWDYPINKVGYHVWEKLWPVAKPVGRWLSKVRR